MFRPRKEPVIIKIAKCSFCKQESRGNVGKLFYCADNECIKKFWKKQAKN